MFTPEHIRERALLKPFLPFRIVTSAGQIFDVVHPDLIWIGHREVHVGTAQPSHPTYYNQVSRLAILHITALQDLPQPAPVSGNGQN